MSLVVYNGPRGEESAYPAVPTLLPHQRCTSTALVVRTTYADEYNSASVSFDLFSGIAALFDHLQIRNSLSDKDSR
jgi:hypothetical protein